MTGQASLIVDRPYKNDKRKGGRANTGSPTFPLIVFSCIMINMNLIQLLGFDIDEISPLMRKESSHYKSQDTVTTMTEMKVALLAYKILFWQFIERFKN